MLNAGASYMPENVPVREALLLFANKTISVAQFAYIQADLSANGNSVAFGDSDMVILNPEEYNI